MAKVFSNGARDLALGHIAASATRLCLCAGAPASASAAVTQVGSGGAMLADLVFMPGVTSGFAVSNTLGGDRMLTVGGQTEVIGHEDGTADHLALVDTSAGEILVLTELTEPQPVQVGTILATRPFTVALGIV